MMIQTNSAQVRDMEVHHAVVQQVLRDLTIGLRGIYGDAIPRVLLFGSQARGEAHADSDIDVLLLFSKPIHPLDEIMRVSNLLCEINLDYGELVSLLPGTEQQFQLSSGPFWRRMRSEAIEITLN
jgi:predicted nucleotidyltransferase